MTVMTHLECDGCGKTVMVAPGATSDVVRLNCTISINCAPDKTYDLCLSCQDRLSQAANPRDWPRVSTN